MTTEEKAFIAGYGEDVQAYLRSQQHGYSCECPSCQNCEPVADVNQAFSDFLTVCKWCLIVLVSMITAGLFYFIWDVK